MSQIVEGTREEVITVATPAAAAISAAMSLVSIPPVPRAEPRLRVDTDEVWLGIGWEEGKRVGTLGADGVDGGNSVESPRGGVLPRVGGVERVDVGEQEEVVGVDHGRGHGGEGVIVAEFDFLVIMRIH